jgi:proliferating cell nuclear antigen
MPRILEVKTVQSCAFRVLVESLKEILTDVNIEFRRKDDNIDNDSTDETKKTDESKKSKGGMKIMAMNAKKTVLIHLKLDANNFDTFMCDKPKIVVGVNMFNLFKLIKTINNADILTLFIDSEDISKLGVKIENAEKKTVTTYRLKLMDLDETQLDVPPTTFDAQITMPSGDFHKLCRDMHNISELIEIQNVGKSVILKGDGDIADQETVLGETINGLKVDRDDNNPNIVQGKYELKHLVMFTKCTSLCTTIDLFMKNDYPLVIRYTVASLGNIILCLAPFMDDV